jgi:hypothetical protein
MGRTQAQEQNNGGGWGPYAQGPHTVHPRERMSEGKSFDTEFNPRANASASEGLRFEEQTSRSTGTDQTDVDEERSPEPQNQIGSRPPSATARYRERTVTCLPFCWRYRQLHPAEHDRCKSSTPADKPSGSTLLLETPPPEERTAVTLTATYREPAILPQSGFCETSARAVTRPARHSGRRSLCEKAARMQRVGGAWRYHFPPLAGVLGEFLPCKWMG